jgi:hypothetical protein
VENDVAAREGGEEGRVVCHIAVDDFQRAAIGGGRREGREVAGAPDQGPDRVTSSQQRVAQFPP